MLRVAKAVIGQRAYAARQEQATHQEGAADRTRHGRSDAGRFLDVPAEHSVSREVLRLDGAVVYRSCRAENANWRCFRHTSRATFESATVTLRCARRSHAVHGRPNS